MAVPGKLCQGQRHLLHVGRHSDGGAGLEGREQDHADLCKAEYKLFRSVDPPTTLAHQAIPISRTKAEMASTLSTFKVVLF